MSCRHQNMNFNFKLLFTFVFLVFYKMVLLKVICPLKMYHQKKYHSPILTSASLVSTSSVSMVEAQGLNYGLEATFNCMTSILNIINIYRLVQKLLRRTQTDRHNCDQSFTYNFKESKGKVKQSRYTPWRRLGGERRYSSYSFSTSALDGGECSASRPGRDFTPGERARGTHCTGGWVGPRAGLDTEDRGKILCPCRGSNPDRPVVQPVVRHYTAWANPTPFKESSLG
jgi:hypothetical protein